MRPGLPAPLINLLGARWALGSPVTASAWFGADGAVAFGLADGTVAIARASWEGAPSLRPREGGGVELVPATGPPPPVTRVRVHQGPCLALAASGGEVFSGGADGRFARIKVDGEVEELTRIQGASVAAVAAHGGVQACAADAEVRLFGDTSARLAMPGPIGALAFDRAGTQLAIAVPHGVTLWADGAADRRLRAEATPLGLAWAPAGDLLVCVLREHGIRAWRLPDGVEIATESMSAPSLSVSFSTGGGFAATAGGRRVACWHFDVADGTSRRTECGPGGGVPISRLACHPTRTLIATGYENGTALLSRPDSTDVLFVREAGGGAVGTLAWSDDGGFLAAGTDAGEAGAIAFPELLFRPAQAST